MARALATLAVALVVVHGAFGAVHIVAPFPPASYVDKGAIGLAVPGAGPAVTRTSALNTLLTGKVESSLLGGATPGESEIDLDAPPPPDVVVTLPPRGKTENRRYPIVLLGPQRGVLTSDSTRIVGLVSLADVANDELRVVAVADPAGRLERLDHRIRWNDRWRLPLTILLGGIAYLVAVAAPRFAPRVFLVGLALNLWLAGWWVVAVVGLAAALLPLGLACAAVIAAYLVTLGLDPESVALSPFGPSQAGRFYGLSNLLATILLVPALVGVAALGRAGVALAVASLVTVGGNRFGADGGGLLVLLAAYGVLWLRVTGLRFTAARLVLLAGAVIVVGLALVGLDAALGGSSHVTTAVADGPWTVLRDIVDRLELSIRRSAAPGPAFAVLASLAVVVWVATRRPRGAVTDAFLVALAVSVVVNDTPGDVLGIGAAAVFAVWNWETRGAFAHPTEVDRLRAMRRTTASLALLLAAIALGIAGCGGEEVSATPETVVGEVPTETAGGGENLPALDLEGDPAAGKQVFESAGCAGCHTLSDAGATGNVGPNLDDAKPSFELVVQRATLGQGGMPSFADQLEPQQIADVAAYVSQAAGG